MNRTLRTAWAAALLALAIILVGCNTATPAAVEPTADLGAVRTEAVKTVVAKMTIEAALNPTATTAPTQEPQTVVITATPAPTEPPAAATATPAPVQPLPTATKAPATSGSGSSGSGGGVSYTATPKGPDVAQFVSASPVDGTIFTPSADFDGVWKFKNVGTKTWTSKYYIKFVDGEQLGLKDTYYLSGDVAPGDTATFIADMKAPSSEGRYVSKWELRNDNGTVFGRFFLVINVNIK